MFSRSGWVFLFLGLALRIWDPAAPIIDAMAARQAQTSEAIRSMIEEPGLQFDGEAGWRGTTGARLVLEFPLYNLLVEGVYHTVDAVGWQPDSPKPGGADPRLIDVSGRVVSTVCWLVAFLLVQAIWRRFLTQRETFWANGIFVFAPLSVFFGQAVMPEMVFLALSTGFVVAVLRYADSRSLADFGLVVVCGLLACLVKFPAFSHLGLLAIAILWKKQGLKFLLSSPAHWVAAVLVLVCMKAWSGYVTSVNATHFADWVSEEVLRGFLGDLGQRAEPMLYVRIGAYVTAFILSPLGVLFAALGFAMTLKKPATDRNFFILAWVATLVVYVLVWGTHTASQHSYYNLPMLVPGAMLFGMGISSTLGWLDGRLGHKGTRVAAVAMAVLILFPLGVMTAYLFRKDVMLIRAAVAVSEVGEPGEPVAVKLNHSPYYIDYMHVPTVAYYSGRPTFMLTRGTAEAEYAAALEECSVIVETLPQEAAGLFATSVKLKGAARPIDPLDRAREAGFKPGEPTPDGLRIWVKEK
jgi:hypothetical protein